MAGDVNPVCEHCGYSLAGLRPQAELYHCPECGKHTVGRLPPAPFRTRRFLAWMVLPTLALGPVVIAFHGLELVALYLAWAICGPPYALGYALWVLDYRRSGRLWGWQALRALFLAWTGNALAMQLWVLGTILAGHWR